MGVDFLEVAYQLERRFAIEISDDEYDHMGPTVGQLIKFVLAKIDGGELPACPRTYEKPPDTRLGRFVQELNRHSLQSAKAAWRFNRRWFWRTRDLEVHDPHSRWTEADVWKSVVEVLVHVLHVKPQDITYESRLVEDLGMS